MTVMMDDLIPLENTFMIDKKSYTQQFSQIYYQRLQSLKPFVAAACKQKWSMHLNDTNVSSPCTILSRLLDLSPGVPSIIIGTLYFDSSLKPNVLRELSDPALTAKLASAGLSLSDTSSRGQPLADRIPFLQGTDKILLEDDSGRVVLSSSLIDKAPFLVSGVVIGLFGVESESGEFLVHDFCTTDFAPQPSLKTVTHGQSRLAIISGLYFGQDTMSTHLPNDLKLDLALEFLSQTTSSTSSARLVLAGNSFPLTGSLPEPSTSVSHSRSKVMTQQRNDLVGLQLLDATLAESSFLKSDSSVASSSSNISDCYLMPGERDPANRALPQQPIHPCLFPFSTKRLISGMRTFKSVSNPCLFEFGGALVLGSSGQNLDDIYRFAPGHDDLPSMTTSSAATDATAPSSSPSLLLDRLALAEWSLRWRHIAPTAPDTLWCYPYYERDPFILKETPHIYFIGNQPEFATKLVQGEAGQKIRIVLVPEFASTGIMVLIDSITLDCWPVCVS